ncbi:hypothetical protein BC936DRAFT_139525 [Jimgerdemannia flammicorona]|uniref:Uncharacterized protein n=1 Tax=Jimgerdemannia flammicorona TaxID=994334 RepID=A0A433B9Q8_9FUNG|nr:hypothetical protein BC936DRAFT_139525 [Jimgerdemannia flammicorona]
MGGEATNRSQTLSLPLLWCRSPENEKFMDCTSHRRVLSKRQDMSLLGYLYHFLEHCATP